MPFGKTEVIAQITDHGIEKSRSPRLTITIYSLTLEYKDENGEVYETNKNVSHFTYTAYSNRSSIPIQYRNSNPYDIFIADQSFAEFINPLFRFETILFAAFIYFDYFLLNKYVRYWWRKDVFKGNRYKQNIRK